MVNNKTISGSKKNTLPNIANSTKENTKKDTKKNTKKDTKKNTKKDTKKDTKKVKSKKINNKFYCGAKDPLPKSYGRLGSMIECAKKKDGIKYWGVKAVDSVILNIINGKKEEIQLKKLELEHVGLMGTVSRLKKEFIKDISDKKKEKIRKEFDKVKKQLIFLEEKIKKIKK